MATDNKISTLVDTQVPEFVVDEGPRFVSFLKAYYEFLEQSNNAIDMSKNILNYRDIDNTLDDFLQYFRYEVMQRIPEDIKADKRILAKYIRDVYETKGAENAYKFLFRALYDDEISIYYPRDYILIASDGRWLQENSVRVGQATVGNISDFQGRFIEGRQSGATGRVERIEEKSENGIQVFELFLENISGEFENAETVFTTSGNNEAEIIATTGVLQDVNIIDGGAFHQQGDIVEIFSASGSGANGVVTQTNDQNSIRVTVSDGGSGYQNNVLYTVSGGSGSGATWRVIGLTNSEIIQLNTNEIYRMQDVPINETPTFTSNGANTAFVEEPLASSNVNSQLINAFTFENTLIGTITTIKMETFGSGYQQSIPGPYTPVDSEIASLQIPDGSGGFKGKNATITPERVPGSIVDLTVNQGGEAFRSLDPVTIDNITRSNALNAEGVPIVTGIRNYPGKYTDTKGFLSWDIVLQDSNFYQIYSYVIRSTQAYNKYREIVKDLLHPAGVNVFGEYVINTQISSSPTLEVIEFSTS